MKRKTRRILGVATGIVIVAAGGSMIFRERPQDFRDKYKDSDLLTDIAGLERPGTYSGYMEQHKEAAYPKDLVQIDLTNMSGDEGATFLDTYEGKNDVVYTEEKSTATFQVEIQDPGFYYLYMEYLIPESRGVAAERSVAINGQLPFEDARNICFSRIWKDGAKPRKDNQGNEIRPTQVEETAWQESYFKDSMGYVTTPYCFYFEQGVNTITLTAVNEPMAIRGLELREAKSSISYQEYCQETRGKDASGEGRTYLQKIQGESSSYRSESSLYAKYDRASASTQPYSVTNTVLNYVGGDPWKSSGQWIEWNFQVPEDGKYHISVKARQNYSRGSVSCRSILIDGQVPFDELSAVGFEYGSDWNVMTLSDEEGTPYEIYLTKGEHTIRMEATLAGVGPILLQLEDSIYRLNQIYRTVLVYIGANPDKYRDYHIEQVYPEILDAMNLESKRLYRVVDEMVAYSGQKSDRIAAAQTIAQQLERFVDSPEKIPLEFTAFKDNITALGAAILNLSETKLDVDYLVISGVDAEVEKDKAGFFAKAWHEMKAYTASYFINYDAVGDVYEDGEDQPLTVWVTNGRDQGTILKSMIDDTFTPMTGVKVNVEIVAPDALLSAVVAGRGPDVVLSIGADQPVNYALRNAVEDLTQFDDIDDVLKPFTRSSYVQYELEDGIYGLPETQSFNVMFYREDILQELGLEVPQTWKELIEMLPTIQGSNMSVGIPTAAGSNTGAQANTTIASNAPDLSLYISLIYQHGGDLYNEKGTRTTVNEEAGVEAFDEYTRYFTDYGIPTVYDFVSRFRSGEMPIGIAGYATYNTLTVSAPEIRGLWKFTMIPGTERIAEDGTTYIDRSNVISGTASMMTKQTDEARKQDAWKFMKWWASTDAQVRFGREIEALLGSSARYATANKEAFTHLAWSAEDIAALGGQWDQTKGIREVPGGYFSGRHLANAVRKVINDKTDPRETVIDYAIAIDDEIEKKRTEFGMPLD